MYSPIIEIIKKRDDKLLVRISQNSEEWEHEYTQEKTFNDLINDYTNGTKNEFPNEIINYLKNQRNQEYSNESFIKDYINKYEEKDIILGDDNIKIPEMIGKPFNDPFCVFAFIKKKKILKMLKFEDKELYGLNDYYGLYTAYCNGDDKLYISGGEKGKKYVEKFWKIDLKTLEIECFDMIPKKNHSMIVIPGNYVFIVGGQDKKTFYYDHENSGFFGWKSLKRNRTEPALILVNNYLYCFDNVYSKEFKNEFTFEKTDLNSENHEWELIQPIMSLPNMKMNQKFFGVVKKDDDILFIGGNMDYDEFKEDGAMIAKNYKLNINSNKLEESELPFTEYNLKEKTFLPYNENIYYIFPDFNKNHPEVIFYRKDKNKVQLVKYESQVEPEENTIVRKNVNDLPAGKIIKINRLDFNQPKLDEKLNININPINTENNDSNKYPEIENKINHEEINNNINDIKIDDNFNNINININTNENNINNMMEQNININNNLINFSNMQEKDIKMKGKYNISSNSNIFKYMDESKQLVIGSTNENNNSNINIEGPDINININQNNNQDINNIEPQKNSLIEEKRSEEEKNEELSKSKNTPTENLQILDDMLKSSKCDEKKAFDNNENIFDTPKIEINNDNNNNNNNIESQNNNINYPENDINLQGSKKEESQKDININLNIEKSINEINGEKQDININNENIVKKEKENEDFCLTGVIKGTKKAKKEKEKEKKDLKKESEEKKDNDLNNSTEFLLTGIILGKKETDNKIIKLYNEKYKSQKKEKENKEQNNNNININEELNIDNQNQNDNNIKIENPFRQKEASIDINNKIEINGNINPNPLNIEIDNNTKDINKINLNFESKSPEIVGTDIKTPNRLPKSINENNYIQPFDINAKNKNLEINANIDNKEKNDDDDDFRLSGIIKGTKYLNIKKENKNESEENNNAPKLDFNRNIIGMEVNQQKIEFEQYQIEENINLNEKEIISIENKEKENNKKETKDLFYLEGIIKSNKNKTKVNESEKNILQGKSENGGIKSENENQLNINNNNENIQSENIAINEQKIDNE